ncbi:hypothetical protein JCM8097_006016 [Rhodosporidiobolus ruineniae]
MASLLAVYDALGPLVRALEDPADPPTPQQLEAAHRDLLNLGRRVPRPATWTTADDAKEDVEALLSGLSGALEHFVRARASLDEPAERKLKVEAKPEFGDAPPTPAEKEDENPLDQQRRSASPYPRRSPSPAPERLPSTPRQDVGAALPPRPENPFDISLSLAHFPALPVPSLLENRFSGPFIRQKEPDLPVSWTDLGGGNAEPFQADRQLLCCKPYLNFAPASPGHPCVLFCSKGFYDELVEIGQSVTVFFCGKEKGDRWHYFGDYRPVAYYHFTGTELGQLDEERQKEWVRFFENLDKKRERWLQIMGLNQNLKGGQQIFDAVVAGKDTIKAPFAVLTCSGFDKVRPIVEKRALRLAYETASRGSAQERLALAAMRRARAEEKAAKKEADKAAKKAADEAAKRR